MTLSTAEKLKICSDRFGKNGYRKPSGNCGLPPVLGCLRFNDPLRQYFSLYQAVSQGKSLTWDVQKVLFVTSYFGNHHKDRISASENL